MDRLRAEEKWQSRARLTETSFSILEPQDEAAAAAPNALQNHGADRAEDWHFERPNVCILILVTSYLNLLKSVLIFIHK